MNVVWPFSWISALSGTENTTRPGRTRFDQLHYNSVRCSTAPEAYAQETSMRLAKDADRPESMSGLASPI